MVRVIRTCRTVVYLNKIQTDKRTKKNAVQITGRLFILIINKYTLTSVRLIQGLVQTT